MPDELIDDGDALPDMPPFKYSQLRRLFRRQDAEFAKVPLSTFYRWKRGQGDLLVSQLAMLLRAMDGILYLRVVSRAQRDLLEVDRQRQLDEIDKKAIEEKQRKRDPFADY